MKHITFAVVIFLACISSQAKKISTAKNEQELDVYGLCQAPSQRDKKQDELFKICKDAYDKMIEDHYNCKENSSTKDEFKVCIKDADRKLKELLIIIE